MIRRGFHAALAAACLTLLGCSVPVASGLDESDANRIVIALDRAGVDATKEIDPNTEGRFRVTVTHDEVPRALTLMRDEELPRPRSPGVLDALDKGALVPSQTAEHAELVAGTAGDLDRSLEGVEGVLSARVHLNLPVPDPLRDGPPAQSTASVLIAHRGSTPPLPMEAVQRLVAGGVPGLSPADVAVVFVSRPAAAFPAESQVVHWGPIAVARASASVVKVGLAFVFLLLWGLLISNVVLLRRRRTSEDAEGAK